MDAPRPTHPPAAWWALRRNLPEAGARLCGLSDIPDDNGLDLVFGEHEPRLRIMLFRVHETVHAWINECPHQKVPVNVWPDVFCVSQTDGVRHLVCEHHWAMFRLRDGYCEQGPCEGASLARVPVSVVGDEVRLGNTEPDAA
ncbi:MAG: Rieske 2Fe-2S domain-containing protein [Burkholderiaceae bacterium]